MATWRRIASRCKESRDVLLLVAMLGGVVLWALDIRFVSHAEAATMHATMQAQEADHFRIMNRKLDLLTQGRCP